MKITNRPGLSKCWVTAAEKDDHEHSGDRSMTELLAPVRVYQLRKRHWDEMEEDVSERGHILLGKAVHYILQQASSAEVMTEQRFNVRVAGFEVSFCPDRVEKLTLDESRPYYESGKYGKGTALYRLKDFKITQVYTRNMLVEKGGKSEWTHQINGYAWALRQVGFPVVEAGIELFMKDWDWKEVHVKKTHGYPPFQMECVRVELYPDDIVQQFLERRITEHMEADKVEEDQLPYCTEEERWATPDLWAVKKVGSDTALPRGKFTSKAEAEEFLKVRRANPPKSLKKGEVEALEIEFRKGESRRCDRYCPAKAFCNQYLEMNPAF